MRKHFPDIPRPNADTDTKPDADANTNADADANTDADTNTHADAYSDAESGRRQRNNHHRAEPGNADKPARGGL